MPLRTILFDAVGTLIYPDPSVATAYAAAAHRHGSRLCEAEIALRFSAAYRRVFAGPRLAFHDMLTSEAIERERWSRVVAEVVDDVEPNASGPLFESLWRHFALPENWQVFDDVHPTLTRLRKCGFTLGIASNFDGRLREILRHHAVARADEPQFLSSEVGRAKPSESFYRHVERALGCRGGEIMLVGDDLENDIRAPQRVGWRTLWIDRPAVGLSALLNTVDCG